MKKTIPLLLFFLGLHFALAAQNIFQFELESCSRVMRNSSAGFTATRIASFQCAALLYLKDKAQTHPDIATSQWLDEQANYLADFLQLYQTQLESQDLTDAQRTQLREDFKNASLAHPVFAENDEDRTLHFVNYHSAQLTPFSLDTQWKTAFYSIYNKLLNGNFRFIITQFDTKNH